MKKHIFVALALGSTAFAQKANCPKRDTILSTSGDYPALSKLIDLCHDDPVNDVPGSSSPLI